MPNIQHLMDYSTFAMELKIHGSVLLPPDLVFSAEELEQLDEFQSLIPEEMVSSGDSDGGEIYVRRIITDKPGEFPTRVNQPLSDLILKILENDEKSKIFRQIFDSDTQYYIRRCQMHRLMKGSHIGLHLDAESNVHNEFAVIIQLGREFEGGEFVVYPENKEPQVYFPTYGSVLITTCKFRHEVLKVLSNERKSLNCFFSRDNGINERDPSAKCSRPGCRWCGANNLLAN